jgi:hypothetical protein
MLIFKGSCKTYLCENCGSSLFTKKTALLTHEKRCFDSKTSQSYSIPLSKDKLVNAKIPTLEFKDFDKLLKVPFRIYADFESYFDMSVNK